MAVTFNFATFAVYILGEVRTRGPELPQLLQRARRGGDPRASWTLARVQIFVFLREKFIVMHFSKDVSLPEDNLSKRVPPTLSHPPARRRARVNRRARC